MEDVQPSFRLGEMQGPETLIIGVGVIEMYIWFKILAVGQIFYQMERFIRGSSIGESQSWDLHGDRGPP